MKRIVCLTVAVLGSALVLHAEDSGKRKTTTDSFYSDCISESEYIAACDQDCIPANDAVSFDNTVQKTSVENMEGKHMGKNMGSINEPQEKKTWSYFNYEYE